MAKKTSAASVASAASSELVASVVLPTDATLQTSVNIAITKDNLVTSYGVRVRNKLEAELKRKQKELTALTKVRDAVHESLKSVCKDYASTLEDTTRSAASGLATYLGITLNCGSSYQIPAYVNNAAPTEITVKVAMCHAEAYNQLSPHTLQLTRTVVSPIPADILALVTEYHQCQIAHQAKQQEILTTQRAFGKVKEKEQECVATMTGMQLEKTEEGRSILARMELAAEQAVEQLLAQD